MNKVGKYSNERNKLLKILLSVFIVLVIVLMILLGMTYFSKEVTEVKDTNSQMELNISNPEDYTWEEYQLLTPEEKAIFPDCFESMDEYYDWYENTKIDDGAAVSTVDLGDKSAEDYTWEEYQLLTPEEKAIFPDYFKSMDEYYDWYENVKIDNGATVPTVDLGDKSAEDYTWEEYQLLTIEEKAIFPDYFESFEAYENWYNEVCPDKQ